MDSKTILITGSTDGIGRQTALELAQMGYEVILHGRKQSRGAAAIQAIQQQTANGRLHYLNADFTDFAEVNHLADKVIENFGKLDVLINNAGVFMNERIVLANGCETTFMVNHLAPFLLTIRLLSLLEKAEAGRIVNVSSMAQAGTIDFDNLNGEKYFDGYNAYALSKLENMLFTYKLEREFKPSSVIVNALHPGVIATKLLHEGWGSGGGSLKQGAETSVFVATSATLDGLSGCYFVNKEERRSSAISYDKKIQDRLWEISLAACGLDDPFRTFKE